MTTQLIIFIVIQFINVVISTVKSILTVSGGKLSAALVNTISYTIGVAVVKMLTSFDFPTVLIITMLTNFIGVYLAKLIIEKKRKDRLWNIHATVKSERADEIENALQDAELTYTAVHARNSRVIFNIYVANKDETRAAKEILTNVSYSVLETI